MGNNVYGMDLEGEGYVIVETFFSVCDGTLGGTCRYVYKIHVNSPLLQSTTKVGFN